MDRLRTLGRDDGQAATEFIGVLAAVALLVALLAASSIAPLVHRSLSSTTCAVLNNPACGSPGSLSPVSLDPPAAAPAEAGEAAPRTFPGNPDTAENNPVDNVFGLVRGVGSQLGEMVTGVVDAVGWGLRSFTSAEQRVENWALWEQIRDHPGESLRAIWDGVKAPIMAEWQAGRPGAAIGRAVTEIASLFFGTKGLDKLRALAAANRLDDVADASRGLTGLRTRLNLADETGAIRLGGAAARLPTRVEAAALLRSTPRVGRALEDDVYHRAGTFLADDVASRGEVFALTGGDKVERVLVQVTGEINGRSGVFEWIIAPEGITHQLFKAGRGISGRPN